jgi:pimeloyl-ACP methyl ester carboxylesterase
MQRLKFFSMMLMLMLTVLPFGSVAASAAQNAAASPPMEGFVAVNGVRLQYLDWGGTGPVVILIHGLADNPHVFDDLAPALIDRFHVIAYARRGSGSSDAIGPYDVDNLTEDLRGLMDALKITRADLVGHSAGGDEITEMAAKHPERVNRMVYLDSGYDWADPDFRVLQGAVPFTFVQRPAAAMSSLDAYRSYQKEAWYRSLDDMQRVEANIRESIIIQPDGSVKPRTSPEVVEQLYSALSNNKPRNYTQVHCPVLAIYPDHVYDVQVGDAEHKSKALAYEQKYWNPFREKSIARIRNELTNVEIARVQGAHNSFFMTDRAEVVGLMRHFFTETAQVAVNSKSTTR